MTDYDASYLAEVEAAFVTARGRGLMLAEADIALVDTWETAGIPVEVVCRALAVGVRDWRERHGHQKPPPHRLKHYREYVEEAASERREGLLGNKPLTCSDTTPTEEDTHFAHELEHLVRSIQQCASNAHDPRVANAWIQIEQRAVELGHVLPLPVLSELILEWIADALEPTLTAQELDVMHARVAPRLATERSRLGSDGAAVRRQSMLREEIAEYFQLETPSHEQ